MKASSVAQFEKCKVSPEGLTNILHTFLHREKTFKTIHTNSNRNENCWHIQFTLQMKCRSGGEDKTGDNVTTGQ